MFNLSEHFFFDFLENFRLVACREPVLREDMQGRARGAERAVHENFVVETAFEFIDAFHGRFDVGDVAVAAGVLVLHVDFEDGAFEPFLFHFNVWGAYRPEKFGSGLFKPDGVGGVVDNSHRVGFCETHFDMCRIYKFFFHGIKYNQFVNMNVIAFQNNWLYSKQTIWKVL